MMLLLLLFVSCYGWWFEGCSDLSCVQPSLGADPVQAVYCEAIGMVEDYQQAVSVANLGGIRDAQGLHSNLGLKNSPQVHTRELEEEIKLLKNLSHPNIVRYLGTVREEETINILLEFVPGGSISSLLGKFGPFPEAVIRMYTKQLLLGLDYLHKNGIMHRDIKGANILVDNKGCIKLADFGASKQVVELANGSGAKSMKGTPYWMAPEVILQTGHSLLGIESTIDGKEEVGKSVGPLRSLKENNGRLPPLAFTENGLAST